MILDLITDPTPIDHLIIFKNDFLSNILIYFSAIVPFNIERVLVYTLQNWLVVPS